ncbi:MAG: UDP-N-acetylglucosamine--N-acetylmuramyl-(pentapeptide) pyrophosphoryl-undecaprenol N-acetylglucosamine transferase, partial [Anaerolineae bacterium]|nr:UDP-N-acetylglucosamine--N-acetylmuramyl-(pentapeptide) pyrophosphoryl-undecaprenol N-acetylglucosamine transferase [Anaerolineae bacterium]
LMIGAGGTGGHVYPALAAAEVLRKSAETHNLVFVGTRGSGGFEKTLVDQSRIAFDQYEAVFAGPLNGVSPLRALNSLLKTALGLVQSVGIVLRHRPQAILLTGGWANVPVALAAWIFRVPILVYLPDIEPGRTIQVLSKFARKVATTVPESAQFFREGQTVTVGYPLREAITSATYEAAIEHFRLDKARKTILVTGGSRGARNINIALIDIVPALVQNGIQIIHVTGELDWERSQQQAQSLQETAHYHAFPYLKSEEMGLAFAAADLIVGRSGASALGEFPYFGAASVLVPYPYAWRYQKTNADWLVEHGAGIRVDDESMSETLEPSIIRILCDDALLNEYKANARSLHQGSGAERLAQELLILAGAK